MANGRSVVTASVEVRAVLTERQLLTRHGRLFLYVRRNPGATATEIAEGLGLSVGSVWTVIGDLRSQGLLIVRRRHRRNVYYANVESGPQPAGILEILNGLA
jgi:DNA-binding MarR family transcriptional regulator